MSVPLPDPLPPLKLTNYLTTKKLDDLIFTGSYIPNDKSFENPISYSDELTYGYVTTTNNEVVIRVMDGREEIAVLQMRKDLLIEAIDG